ncbi:GL10795 [Drosophila persimilis]|uniref:GL10795 n=1 Tax=Drosophila persimilis TaxID=7234 RepID=B4G9Y7_DROPE|nr:GL10795 [Drosophila persimilis]
MFIQTIIGLVTLLALCTAFEEHPHFCIETQPLLLADIDRHVVIPTEKDLKCHIKATTLTTKEKESFIDTMCTDHGSTTVKRDNHHFFKLHNGELSGRGPQSEICNNDGSSVLAWVPYPMMLKFYAPELNPKERLTYIAKATSVEREKTELCHFRHTDLVNAVSDNLFTCVVMIFGDNFYGLEDNINVLVELEPLMYQLRNITYMPWRNITNSYKMHLGDSKIHLNTSSIYQDEHLTTLPLVFEPRGSVLELDADGVGGLDVEQKAYFGRSMDPRSEVKVQVIGQWVDQHREFSADIYEYYGNGLRRYRQPISGARLTFVRIDNTEPAFEAPESNNLVKASLFREHQLSRLSLNGSAANFTEWENATEDEDEPGFYSWFVVTCLLVAVAVIIGVYLIVRTQSRKSKKRQKYDLANTSAPPA